MRPFDKKQHQKVGSWKGTPTGLSPNSKGLGVGASAEIAASGSETLRLGEKIAIYGWAPDNKADLTGYPSSNAKVITRVSSAE